MSFYNDEVLRTSAARAGARVYRSTDQSITASTNTPISFDFASYNPVNMWTSAAPTKITARVSGYYLVTGTVTWDTSASGTNLLHSVYLNGTTEIAYVNHIRSAINQWAVPATSTYFLSAGDYVELAACQDSAGALLAITRGVVGLTLAAHRLP